MPEDTNIDLPVYEYMCKPTFTLPGYDILIDRYVLKIGVYQNNQMRIDLTLVPPNNFENPQDWEITRNLVSASAVVGPFCAVVIDDKEVNNWLHSDIFAEAQLDHFIYGANDHACVFKFDPEYLYGYDPKGYMNYVGETGVVDPLSDEQKISISQNIVEQIQKQVDIGHKQVDVSHMDSIPIRSMSLPKKLLGASVHLYRGERLLEGPLVDVADELCQSGHYGDFAGIEDVLSERGVYYVSRGDFVDPNVLTDPEIRTALELQEARYLAQQAEYARRLDRNAVPLQELLTQHIKDEDFAFYASGTIQKLTDGIGFYNSASGEGVAYHSNTNELVTYSMPIKEAFALVDGCFDALNKAVEQHLHNHPPVPGLAEYSVIKIDPNRDLVRDKINDIVFVHWNDWAVDTPQNIAHEYFRRNTPEILFDAVCAIESSANIGCETVDVSVDDGRSHNALAAALMACSYDFTSDGQTFTVKLTGNVSVDELLDAVADYYTCSDRVSNTDKSRYTPTHVNEPNLISTFRADGFEQEVNRAQFAAHTQSKQHEQEKQQELSQTQLR